MRKEIIDKVDAFIRKEIGKSAHYKDNIKRAADYRIEHSYRVAHILQNIAKEEGFDEERAFIGGLLHDIGYSIDYDTFEDFKNHGRDGARIAREFLKSLNVYSNDEIEEICFGIAIHVDDKADFDYPKTKLALSIGDADNIDRFDGYRLYESLHMQDYMNLPIEEQKEFVNKKIDKLKVFKTYKCGTETGTRMWNEKIDFQIEFFNKLLNQINNSK